SVSDFVTFIKFLLYELWLKLIHTFVLIQIIISLCYMLLKYKDLDSRDYDDSEAIITSISLSL
ncbi:hypothetical protein L9F63_020486, partial [Diploptera punctata]